MYVTCVAPSRPFIHNPLSRTMRVKKQLARTVWTAIVLAFFMGLQLILSKCRRRVMVDVFISLSVAVFLAILVVEIGVVIVASRGSIIETHGTAPGLHVSPLASH